MIRVPEEIERLISERQDGALTAEQLDEVRRFLSTNPDAAALARQYDNLDRILPTIRKVPVGVNFPQLHADLSRRILDEAEYLASTAADAGIDPSALAEGHVASGPRMDPLRRKYERVDGFLQSEMRPVPEIDWAAFHSRVSGLVREESRQQRRGGIGRWLVRAGVPLAAAAAIFLAVSQPHVESPSVPGSRPAQPSVVSVALDAPRQSGKVTIAFDTSAPPTMPEVVSTEAAGIVIASGTAQAMPADSTELALLF